MGKAGLDLIKHVMYLLQYHYYYYYHRVSYSDAPNTSDKSDAPNTSDKSV